MNPELYGTFIIISAAVIASPGPNVLLIISIGLKQGAKAGATTMLGTLIAMAIQLSVAAVGVSSLMLVLAEWFEWLRWLGIAYLIYLGGQQLINKPDDIRQTPSSKRLFWQGFLVSLTNPKTMLFVAAFIPQFIDASLPALPQLMAMSLTFFVLAALFDGVYILLSSKFGKECLSERSGVIRDRLSGSLLIGVGVLLGLVDIKSDS